MKQIIKNMLILLLLIFLLYILPNENKKEPIKEISTIKIEKTEKKDITNRSDEIKKEEIIKIYDFNNNTNVNTKSNISAEEYNKMLQGTKLNNIGEFIYNAEQQYNVNGLYIMGLACLESAYGSSNYAINRNNLFGYNAVDSNPDKATYFKSKESCIMFVTEKLSKNYLNENGCYFGGYTAKDIDKHYCTDKQHANKIINIINELEKKL